MRKIGFDPRCEEDEGGEAHTSTHHKDGTTSQSTSYWRRRHPFETLVETLGVSGIIAIIVISTVSVIFLVQTLRGHEVSIPSLLGNITMLIVGYYFGQKTTEPPHQKHPIGFTNDNCEQTAPADADKPRR